MGWRPAASASVAAAQHWRRTEEAFVGLLEWHGPQRHWQWNWLSGMGVFQRVCEQNADTLSNCCTLYNSIVCRTVWWDNSFHQTGRLYGVAHLNLNFPQIVRQHILGVVGYILSVFCTICSSFQQITMKEFWKSVRCWQSYRHQLVVHFLGHSVYTLWTDKHIKMFLSYLLQNDANFNKIKCLFSD